MYFNRERRLCFLANPRTGSESVANALKALPDWEQFGDHHTTPPDAPHIDLQRGWSVATTVRSHWDTFPSWLHFHWRERVEPFTVESLEQIVQATPWITPTSLFGLMLPYANVVLRFETLDDDLRLWLGAPLDRAHLGQSILRRPAAFYWTDKDAVAWVVARYGYELREWGYPTFPPA
jgi:hypothetical protein